MYQCFTLGMLENQGDLFEEVLGDLHLDLRVSDSFSLIVHTIYAYSMEGHKSYKVIIIMFEFRPGHNLAFG